MYLRSMSPDRVLRGRRLEDHAPQLAGVERRGGAPLAAIIEQFRKPAGDGECRLVAHKVFQRLVQRLALAAHHLREQRRQRCCRREMCLVVLIDVIRAHHPLADAGANEVSGKHRARASAR